MPESVSATGEQPLPRIPRLAIYGAYSDSDLYQRNRALITALSSHSDDTLVLRPLGQQRGHSFAASLSTAARLKGLLTDSLSLFQQRHQLAGSDTLFVPYPAYAAVLILWLTGKLRGRRLIVDAFLDLYSTVVDDRGLLPDKSLRAQALLAFQRVVLCRADLILIDTAEHAVLLHKRLGNDPPRIAPIPVGIDESQWSALEPAVLGERCRLVFWGTFIPLHGIPCILDALRLLEERALPVECLLIGDGQVADAISRQLESAPLRSLSWERSIQGTSSLRRALADAHIALGVFGDSQKAASVVPYKVHQALASNRAVITRASPAVETAADAEHGLVTVPPADPAALADAIEALWVRLCSGWVPATRNIFVRHYGRAAVEAAVRCALENPEQSS